MAERAFLADRPIPRTRAEFETLREAGRERIGLAVQDAAAVVGPLLEAHHETRLALEKAGGSRWRYAIDDMWDQLRNLVAAGFLTATPWPWLQHAARYCARSASVWSGFPAATWPATRFTATRSSPVGTPISPSRNRTASEGSTTRS